MLRIKKLVNLWPIILVEISKNILIVGQSTYFYLICWSKEIIGHFVDQVFSWLAKLFIFQPKNKKNY